MDTILLIIVKVSEHKLGLFEYAQSMSKWPKGLIYIGNTINYLLSLPDPFPRGFEVDLERIGTFFSLMLLMHINRLGLVSHMYGSLYSCITICQSSWAGTTAPCIEIGWR